MFNPTDVEFFAEKFSTLTVYTLTATLYVYATLGIAKIGIEKITDIERKFFKTTYQSIPTFMKGVE